jgi:MSHA pilin protein MshA
VQHPLSLWPRSDGFSLTELVVAVTLIGIAAAFAIPRFTHWANHAHASEVVGLSTNLREATRLAHSQYLWSGRNASAVIVNGRSIALLNGYPDASSHGIRNAIFHTGAFKAKAAANSVKFSKTGAAADDRCSVIYNIAPAEDSPATITNPDLRAARLRESRIFMLRVYAHIA